MLKGVYSVDTEVVEIRRRKGRRGKNGSGK